MLQGLSNSGDLYKRRKHEGKTKPKKTGSDSTLEDQIFCPKDGVHLTTNSFHVGNLFAEISGSLEDVETPWIGSNSYLEESRRCN